MRDGTAERVSPGPCEGSTGPEETDDDEEGGSESRAGGDALAGWTGAAVAQLAAIRATDPDARSKWTVTRNQCLLISTVSMNTVILHTLYRYAKSRRRASGDGTEEPIGRSARRSVGDRLPF